MPAYKVTDITAILRCKVAVCGDSMVGKTALISTYTSGGQKFPKAYNMTTGVDVVVAQVPIVQSEGTALVELFLHDTSGSDLYKDSRAPCWNGIYYVMLVFDVTSMESFDNVQRRWIEELKLQRPDKERPLKGVVVATKTDLPSQRHRVPLPQAQDWAVSQGLEFFEVSAQPPGKDVDKAFEALARAFHRTYEEKVKAYQDACQNY